MNNNIENYKKAVEKIHPSEELVNKTITNAINAPIFFSSYYIKT